jgi:hypothetical protein
MQFDPCQAASIGNDGLLPIFGYLKMSRWGSNSHDEYSLLFVIDREVDPSDAVEECHRLRRYICACQPAHRKKIEALLAQLRQNGRQIAELRITAGVAANHGVRAHDMRIDQNTNSKIAQQNDIRYASEGGVWRRRARSASSSEVMSRHKTTRQNNKQGTRK